MLALFNPDSVRTLAIDLEFPSIEKGLAWLERQDVLPIGRREQMVADAEAQADVAWRPAVTAFDKAINREAIKSIAAGESGDRWQVRVAKIGDLQRHIGETIHRTLGKRADYAGQTEALPECPEVASRFPYLQLLATDDTRVRPTHWAVNKKVARIGSPLHTKMVEILNEWQCRCSGVPLTLKQAQRIGIDDDTGAPPPPPPEETAAPIASDESAQPASTSKPRSTVPNAAVTFLTKVLIDRLTGANNAGNNQRIPQRIRDLFPPRFRPATTTNELFAIEGGRDWWVSNIEGNV